MRPRPVVVRFSSPHARSVVDEASGETLGALVHSALARAGLAAADEAPLVLGVSGPGAAFVPAAEQPHRDVETHDRDLARFVRALAADARKGRSLVIADGAYQGGAESALEEELARAFPGALRLAAGPRERLPRLLDRATRALAELETSVARRGSPA